MAHFRCLLPGALLLGACVNAPQGEVTEDDADPTPNAASAAAEGATGPVIGTLKRRNDALVITASGNGPRFTVRDAGGAVTAQGLTEAQLENRFGELHRVYRTSVARGDSAPFLDARVEPAPAQHTADHHQRDASSPAINAPHRSTR